MAYPNDLRHSHAGWGRRDDGQWGGSQARPPAQRARIFGGLVEEEELVTLQVVVDESEEPVGERLVALASKLLQLR